MMDNEVWTTLITTADYAEGVICLALSLTLVKSKAPLLCYVPSEEVATAILNSTMRSSGHALDNLLIKRLPKTAFDEIFLKDVDRDPSLFIDASRRFLFLEEKPFIFLDSDMIATQNFDELLDLLTTSNEQTDVAMYCVVNFRNKQKKYGTSFGNFNAGMMVVPKPQIKDYNTMMDMLRPGYNDTEEKMLNEVFRNSENNIRWNPLEIGYNCQKRAFKLAPHVWNAVHSSEMGIKIVHYVGGKPWQSAEELQRLDWEAKVSPEAMVSYEPLFQLWRNVRNGTITTAEMLKESIPLAVVEGTEMSEEKVSGVKRVLEK